MIERHGVILAANINKNSADRKLTKALYQIGIIEAFYQKFQVLGPASHARDREQIDRVWPSNRIILMCMTIFSH